MGRSLYAALWLGALALVAALTACGSSESRPTAGLPSVPVRDFDGPTIDLASLSPREKPLLVWIWGPF